MTKLPMLTETGVKRFHDGLREHFPSVSLDDVRKAAKQCHEGMDSGEDVIAALLRADIEECVELIGSNPRSAALRKKATELFERTQEAT